MFLISVQFTDDATAGCLPEQINKTKKTYKLMLGLDQIMPSVTFMLAVVMTHIWGIVVTGVYLTRDLRKLCSGATRKSCVIQD